MEKNTNLTKYSNEDNNINNKKNNNIDNEIDDKINNKINNTDNHDEKNTKNNSANAKAHELAKAQRDISIAEFFEKNRHLLGFDNKRKALLTTIKEGVDNSIDACEEADILPEIVVEIIDLSNDKYRVIIEDNGPGIVKEQIPKIFAKLLYGSKFHKLKMQRGQQGIGISAAVMYSQLTTGKATKILSKIHPDEPAHYYELKINTQKNEPEIVSETTKEWHKDHGTRVELELESSYIKGAQSVDEYLKETAIINPHVTIIYQPPKGEQIILVRVTDTKPIQPKEIKPHPYGVEVGMMIKMLSVTKEKNVKNFLMNDFSRVSPSISETILENATLLNKEDPKKINREQAEKLITAIRNTKIMMPPTDCIIPIGSELLEKGLKKEINAEFYTSISRTPQVYRGNPFLIEGSLAYGGIIPKEGSINIMRFANKVPLLYQQGACAISEAVTSTSWKQYGLQQSGKNMPQGPVIIVIHVASVWVPFTSEAKEAIAHYPELIKEIKLCIQELGRNLGKYVNKKKKVGEELKKRSYIETYIPHIAEAIKEILPENFDKNLFEEKLRILLEKTRGKVEELKFDPEKNEEYDEDLAKIGKDEEGENDD